MGSLGQSKSSSPDIHVLVTGFGLFHDHPANASWLIAASLPPTITSAAGRIHIHTLPGAIEVSYRRIRATVPGLLFPRDSNKPSYDIVLHLGMAASRGYYSVEAMANRDDYDKMDATGENLKGDTYWKTEFGSPEVLKPGFEPYQVLKKWKESVPEADLRVSEDGGRYLCEFTFYTSMVEYKRRIPGGECPVMFLHVPEVTDEVNLEKGRQATLGLISSLAELNA